MDVLFLDANIFFAAVASEHGASHALFRLAEKKVLKLTTNEYVLLEAKVNIEKKLGENKLSLFYQLLSHLSVVNKRNPTLKEMKAIGEIINAKDVPVLAGAYYTKADYLISLDRKAFFHEKIKNAKFPFKICLPGNFINNFLR